MRDFVEAFQKLGFDLVQPLVLLGLNSQVPILLFWILRSLCLPRVAFGIEFFGLLFASDFMVSVGLIEAWRGGYAPLAVGSTEIS